MLQRDILGDLVCRLLLERKDSVLELLEVLLLALSCSAGTSARPSDAEGESHARNARWACLFCARLRSLVLPPLPLVPSSGLLSAGQMRKMSDRPTAAESRRAARTVIVVERVRVGVSTVDGEAAVRRPAVLERGGSRLGLLLLALVGGRARLVGGCGPLPVSVAVARRGRRAVAALGAAQAHCRRRQRVRWILCKVRRQR